jgi:hypothetical protein
VEGSCERGNEPSGSIKRWEVLEWLHNLQLLKKGSAPRVSEGDLISTPDNGRHTGNVLTLRHRNFIYHKWQMLDVLSILAETL